MAGGEYQSADAHLLRQPVKRFALYKFTSCVGKKALPFAGEVSVNNVAHDGVEYGIAQEFKPFVVYGLAVCPPSHYAFVHQGELIVANVSRIKPKNLK